jgi:hypothetical protein
MTTKTKAPEAPGVKALRPTPEAPEAITPGASTDAPESTPGGPEAPAGVIDWRGDQPCSGPTVG